MKTIQLKDSIVVIHNPMYSITRIYENTRLEMCMSKRELGRYLKSIKESKN